MLIVTLLFAVLMAGRYGPYVSDGAIHATLPKGTEPTSVTLDQAVEWINAKAAKGPVKKSSGAKRRGRGTAKR